VEIDSVARDILVRWREHPASFVREVFKATPDAWQEDVLEAFPHRQRQAMTCCKGPGKTTLLSWLGWNFMITRVDARCAALSVTADTLRDTLWAELGYWYAKSPILQQMFVVDGERITSRFQPKTWWISARSFPRSANPSDQATALQGLHAENALLLIDEAGGVPRSVLATGEAVLTGGGDQHIVLAGNPNNQDSALGQAVINQRKLWDVTEVTGDPDDPKRSPRVNIDWARQQIEAWGKDNPWVLVNVFGRFPPSAINTLISPDEVRDAQKRHYIESQYADFPKILGVDVAGFGDDESVIFKRQGKVSFPPLRMRNLDSLQGAAHVANIHNEWKGQSIQIDATGGYGAGWYDQLRAMSYEALPVQFAGKPHNPGRFFNKRAEIWWEMCEWIKDGGALPPVPEMVAGLSTATYSFKGDRIILEDKKQIKERLQRSPDLEDALACTFAYPVAPRPTHVIYGSLTGLSQLIQNTQGNVTSDYDPFERYSKEKSYD
jgi:phage terminase large subunit